MNTQPVVNEHSTNLPPAEVCSRHVADARRLFQRTLAKWASDVLILRRDDARRGNTPGEPAWDGPARSSLTLSHPDDEHDGWNLAA